MGGFEGLGDVAGLGELHPHYLFLVVHVLALRAPDLQVYQVV